MMRSFDSDLKTPATRLSPDHLGIGKHEGTNKYTGIASGWKPSFASDGLSQPVLRTQIDHSSKTDSLGSDGLGSDGLGSTGLSPMAKWQGPESASHSGAPSSALTGLERENNQGQAEPEIGSLETPVSSGSSSGSIASITAEDTSPEAEEPERGLLPVLRNSNFLVLWSGQVFSQLADKVYLVLMIALIASRFQSEGQTISGWVSSLMIAFTIPAVLFGSIAGVFVDHWRKRAVLVTTNLLRGGLVLGLPILLWLTQGWSTLGGLPVGFVGVLGITLLVSTLTQFFAPAEQAVIPLIVERRHLLSANSLYTMTMMASVIVGFALGDPLLALADQLFSPLMHQLHAGTDIGKELVVGGSYVVAGSLLMLLRTNEKTVDPHEELPDVWQNIQDGVRYLGQQGQVRAALICQVILFSIFAALAVLAVRLAEVMPEITASQFGFLLAAGGVGMAIGAILVGQFGQRFSRAQLSLYGSVGMAAVLATVSFFTQHLFPTLPLLVLLGACAAIVGVPMQTAIQEETPEEMRGKVFGLQNNAINIALSLPLALAGIAETWLGLQTVFLGLAILAFGGGILTWSISRGHNPVK